MFDQNNCSKNTIVLVVKMCLTTSKFMLTGSHFSDNKLCLTDFSGKHWNYILAKNQSKAKCPNAPRFHRLYSLSQPNLGWKVRVRTKQKGHIQAGGKGRSLSNPGPESKFMLLVSSRGFIGTEKDSWGTPSHTSSRGSRGTGYNIYFYPFSNWEGIQERSIRAW